jgi:hypothetical protein
VLRDFYAYSIGFHGGVFVAGGDINGDGLADIITGPGLGGGPEVRAFDGASGLLLRDFFAYPQSTAPQMIGIIGLHTGGAGGLHVAVTTINGQAAILTGPGPGQLPEVRAFDAGAVSLLDDFFAYDPAFVGGVFVG